MREPIASRPASTFTMLWRYALGYTPLEPSKPGGAIRWKKASHRGVIRLDHLEIPRKQKNYVFSPRFELRFNTAFEQVLRYCSNPQRDERSYLWISSGLIRSYLALYQLGYAYSFESWEGDRLVGGGFGVRFGGYVCVDSGFCLVDNASKASFVRMLLALRDKGYEWVDLVGASPHVTRWGAEWVPQWEFEQWMGIAEARAAVFPTGEAVPRLPWSVRAARPMLRAITGLARKVGIGREPEKRDTGETAENSPHGA